MINDNHVGSSGHGEYDDECTGEPVGVLIVSFTCQRIVAFQLPAPRTPGSENRSR